ncbi:hypothetical protein [Levilactobacillus tujiorum]|uniref:hypothetical protein n=1 Tax=Levilactobacillus tujiorum TaxID=2912243 RepID=UPI001B3B1CE7|nr:hypothetical protein [Levilactobacillus tujiorum]
MRTFTDGVIARSTPNVMSTMVHLLSAKSELVRYNAAKDLLDRAGFMPTIKQDVNANVGPVRITDDVPAGAMTMTRLSITMAPSFYELHQEIKHHQHSNYWLSGGHGSTRSSFISAFRPS